MSYLLASVILLSCTPHRSLVLCLGLALASGNANGDGWWRWCWWLVPVYSHDCIHSYSTQSKSLLRSTTVERL